MSDASPSAATEMAEPMPASRASIVPSLVIAVVWALLDQLSKRWALTHLSDGHVDHLFWTLRFNLTRNSGMAFSRGQGFGPILGALALVVVVGLLVSLRRTDSRLGQIGVGLVIGGAIGNLTDRLFRDAGWLRGSVIDFIDPQWWPLFNVADIGIVVGGILLVIGAVTAPKPGSA